MNVLSILFLLSYCHLFYANKLPEHNENQQKVHQRTSKSRKKEEKILGHNVSIPAILRYITNRPSAVHKVNTLKKVKNISKQRIRKKQSKIVKENKGSLLGKHSYDVTTYSDETNIPENPFAWKKLQVQSQVRHSISQENPFVRETSVFLNPADSSKEGDSKVKNGGLINLSNWTSTTTPKQTSVLLLHRIDFKKLLQYLKNKKNKLEHDLYKSKQLGKTKQEGNKEKKVNNVLNKLKMRLKWRSMNEQHNKTNAKPLQTLKKKKYVVKTAEKNVTRTIPIGNVRLSTEKNSNIHLTNNNKSEISTRKNVQKTNKNGRMKQRKTKSRYSHANGHAVSFYNANNVSSAEELSDIEDDVSDNITEDETVTHRVSTHNITSNNLPENSEDKKITHHDNKHIYRLLRKNGLFDHVPSKKKHKYETRKDEIPHPLNHENVFYTRRSELPFYSLPANPVPSEQLISFPAQYPELLNLQPMNRLYTSLQGLDTNEENLLGSFLKKERLEEESLQETDPDKIIRTDDRGNLYQDDILNTHVTPTKLIDQKTMNDISKADESALSSLVRLDKNVLKDTSKIGQSKLMGASILDQADMPKAFASHSSDEENRNSKYPAKLSENDISAIKKLKTEGMLGNDVKIENAANKDGNGEIATTPSSNLLSLNERRKTEGEAVHLLRNLAIRNKLEKIKMLQDKLRMLQRLEASRRKHLMMKPDSPSLSNNHLTETSPTDLPLLKNFFNHPYNLQMERMASNNKGSPANSSSIFQDALYDRGKILKWKYRDVAAFKKEFKDYFRPMIAAGYFQDLSKSKRSRRHRNFHLAGKSDSNNMITDETFDQSKHITTGKATKLSQNESDTSNVQDLKHSASLISETDESVVPFNHLSHFIKDQQDVDETENGVTKSMNEFQFNGQIKLDPKYQGNVKIVHGTPPPDFMEAFPTAFPILALTTPVNRYVSLPPVYTTSRPTYINGYPWAWFKIRKNPTNKHLKKPTREPPTKSVITSTKYLKIITTHATSPEEASTVASPLAEDYIMQDMIGNATQNHTSLVSTVDKPIQVVDGEVELENVDVKTTPKTLKIETPPHTTGRPVNVTTVKVDSISFNVSSNETAHFAKEPNISNNSSLGTSNYTAVEGKGNHISGEESQFNNDTKDFRNPKKEHFSEKSAKNEKISENATTREHNITSVPPAPLYVTYEENSRHHNSFPNDIVLDESKDVETKENIRNEEGTENRFKSEERMHYKNGHKSEFPLWSTGLQGQFDPNKIENIRKYANVHPDFFADNPGLSNIFHLRAKPGSLYFHKPTHDDVEVEAGDRRTYQQTPSLKEMEEDKKKKLLHEDNRPDENLNTYTDLKGTAKSTVGTASQMEDFENYDKMIERKTTPTEFAFATKSHGVEAEPEVLEDSILKEYARQSSLNKKYTAEILQNIGKNGTSSLSERISGTQSTSTEAARPTLNNISKSQDDKIVSQLPEHNLDNNLMNKPLPNLKSSLESPTNKERGESVAPHLLTTPTAQTTTITTTSTTTTPSITTTTPPTTTSTSTVSSSTIDISQYKQANQLTYKQNDSLYPTIKSFADTKSILLNEARTTLTLPKDLNDVNSVGTVETSAPKVASNTYRFQQQQPGVQMYLPMVPTAFQKGVKPTFETYTAQMRDSSITNPEYRYYESPPGKVLSYDIPTATTTKSPFEDRLNLEDMYWTDSSDEIENACKQQKGTQLVVNILAFGDSLTRGYYNRGKNHHPYTMKLQYLLNKMDAKKCFIVENEGKDGDLAFGEMPRRIEEVFRNNKKQYDWVIILGGTNDIYNKHHAGRHKAEELTQNILAVHNIAHHHGSRTIAVTIPDVACESSDICQDMKQTRDVVNYNLRAYANDHRNSVLLCDLADSLVRHKISHKLVGQFFEGGLHLKPRGYETMAKLIFEAMKQVLDK